MPDFRGSYQYQPGDPIAVTVKRVALQEPADPHITVPGLGWRLYENESELYLVTVAIDEKNGVSKQPSLGLNWTHFHPLTSGQDIRMERHGHLIYGPGDPGSFVSTGVMIMESDTDIREFGATLEEIVKATEKSLALGALLKAANPMASLIATGLAELLRLVGSQLRKNKDDLLMTAPDSYLYVADVPNVVPFDLERLVTYKAPKVHVDTLVLPLSQPNNMGAAPMSIPITS